MLFFSFLKQRLFFPTLLFFGVCVFLRALFFIWESVQGTVVITHLPLVLGVGFIYDTITAFYYLFLPTAFYLLLLPSKMRDSRVEKIFSCCCLFAALFVFFFGSVGEILFWYQFHSRYNFVAVDYFAYIKEISLEIIQTYPYTPYLTFIVLLFSAFLAFFFSRYRRPPASLPPLPFPSRTVWGVLSVSLLALFLAGIPKPFDVSHNRVVNEVAKNGLYVFGFNLRHRQIQYDKWYIQRYGHKNLPELKTLVGNKNDIFLNPKDHNNITRWVNGREKEENKNVMIILMEGQGTSFMKQVGNAKNLTPNLDALAQDSLSFTQAYATGIRTVRALEAVILSRPPAPGVAVIRKNPPKSFLSIAHLFKERDYATAFFYGGDGHFDNMESFFQKHGFDHIIDINHFTPSERSFENAWGLCDQDLYGKASKHLTDTHRKGQKFFYVLMTTSNHTPFTFPEGLDGIPPKGGGQEAGFKYADYALGEFLQHAKTQPWFSETIFVILADHATRTNGIHDIQLDAYHIPLLFFAPGFITPAVNHVLASQIDVAPTLLALLGFSYQSQFYGRNLLSQEHSSQILLSTFEKLALFDGRVITVLKPGKTFIQYTPTHILSTPNENALLKTIAFYVHSTKWRDYLSYPLPSH